MKPDDANFLDRLKKLTLIRDAVAATAVADVKSRQRLVDENERLDREALVRLPALRQEVADSLVEVKKFELKMRTYITRTMSK